MYYTTSSCLPLNETCKRLVEVDPLSERLFWKGDILLVRYTGELGTGHEYSDAPAAMLGTVADVLKGIYSKEELKEKADFDKKLDLKMERKSEWIAYISSFLGLALCSYRIADLRRPHYRTSLS
jgi:hypothetical protein